MKKLTLSLSNIIIYDLENIRAIYMTEFNEFCRIYIDFKSGTNLRTNEIYNKNQAEIALKSIDNAISELLTFICKNNEVVVEI